MAKIQRNKDILVLTRTLNKCIDNDFSKRAEEQGITSAQARVLLFIHHNNEKGVKIRQVDLEKNFNLSKSTISGIISRMERNGIIKRKKESRSIYLLPDVKGEQIVDALAINRNKVIEKCLKGFDEKEKEQFLNNINRVISNFNEKEESETCGKTSS